MKRFLPLLFVASTAAAAAPVITSVTPNSGPVTGGTRVVIKGSGFSDNCIICSPPFGLAEVSFGTTRATGVKFIDSSTLEAVTPPQVPGTVAVTVRNMDGTGIAILPQAFTYFGEMSDVFEPVLFPIFTRPIFGAFGSEFRTQVRVFNKEEGTPIQLYGNELNCLVVDPYFGPFVPIPINGESSLVTDCSSTVGRVFWVPKGSGSALAANIRVADVTREADGHGTEIPVVHQNEFTTGRIALLGIPSDPRFRVMLRIYSTALTTGPVNIAGLSRQVFLTPGRNVFEPSYAEVSDLPRGLSRVVIAPSAVPLWAFITVTNNATQQITTITPN